ncbi:MAG TPA: energy transducer TonB [Methylotenera sp.]|nr:energy transducer TonB [Methylotenera sp.]
MNSRIVISSGLSIVIHGFVFWMLMISFPESASKSSLSHQSQALTVNLFKPKLSSEPNSTTASEKNSEEYIYPMEVSNDLKNTTDNEINSVNTSLNFPEPKYYTITELDESPAILENINLNPPELVNYPQGGKLTVRLWIDIDGSVVKVELVKSELPEEFVKSALASFLETKFSPGLKANAAVRSVVKIVVQYTAMDYPVD